MTKTDFSRAKCPICGVEIIFKINKNGVLYTFCRNSHHVKLGKYDSKEAIEAIEGGKAWHSGVMHLYPLNHQQHQEMKGRAENVQHGIERRTTNEEGTSNGNYRIIERRPTNDAGTGTNGGAGTDQKPAKRSVDIGFW